LDTATHLFGELALLLVQDAFFLQQPLHLRL